MTKEEINIAKSVFGDSIDYDRVRVNEGNLFNKINGGAPFVTGHTINTPNGFDLSDVYGQAKLVHELTHVWQYEEMGLAYATHSAFREQAPWADGRKENLVYDPQLQFKINRGNAYDYGGPDALKQAKISGKSFADFEIEEQAEIVEHYYIIKNDANTVNDSLLGLYTHFVKAVEKVVHPLLDTGSDETVVAAEEPSTAQDEESVGGNIADRHFGDDREAVVLEESVYPNQSDFVL